MTEEPLLKSARLKHGRAYKLFVDLESDIGQFFQRNLCKVVRERDSDTGKELLVYYPTESIPDWSLPIGEILQNLRSSLDHAADGLTVKEVGTALDNTEFPIFDDCVKYFAAKNDGTPQRISGLYKIRGLSQKTQDCIESVQPYYAVSPDQIAFIKILHDLNIVDKHRELHLCRVMTQIVEIRNPYVIPLPNLHLFSPPSLNLDKRAVVARWNFTTDEHGKIEMYAGVSPQIAFDSRNLDIFKKPESILPMLLSIIFTVDHVLNQLDASVS